MKSQKPIVYNLKKYWYELCQQVHIPSNLSNQLFRELIDHYEEAGRYYHTSNHIYYMLNKYDLLANLVQKEIPLKFAIWYHDIIYNSKAKDNEEKSAELALKRLSLFELTEPQIQEVNLLISTTKKHLPIADIPDSKILLDLDLAIFGVQAQDYQVYSQNIRKEYEWVPGFIYRKNRKKVLDYFLMRDRLYFTDIMYEKYESQARENIQNEIAKL